MFYCLYVLYWISQIILPYIVVSWNICIRLSLFEVQKKKRNTLPLQKYSRHLKSFTFHMITTDFIAFYWYFMGPAQIAADCEVKLKQYILFNLFFLAKTNLKSLSCFCILPMLLWTIWMKIVKSSKNLNIWLTARLWKSSRYEQLRWENLLTEPSSYLHRRVLKISAIEFTVWNNICRELCKIWKCGLVRWDEMSFFGGNNKAD